MEVGTVSALRRLLQNEGFDEATYAFSDTVPGYWGYRLIHKPPRWIISYYERGEVHEVESSEDEGAACVRFLALMREDFPPRKKPGPK